MSEQTPIVPEEPAQTVSEPGTEDLDPNAGGPQPSQETQDAADNTQEQ